MIVGIVSKILVNVWYLLVVICIIRVIDIEVVKVLIFIVVDYMRVI